MSTAEIVAGLLLPALVLGVPRPRVAAPKPAVADKVKDRFVPAPYERQTIRGLLGERMRVNLEGRLLNVDQRALLAGFQQRPGSHPWIGEHAGKFLHAAANTWAYSGDERLKTMMDRVAAALIATQLPDGYLGTYTDDRRWTSWDVWVHKYDLIGLLSHYCVAGDAASLEAAQAAGDLLARTFGARAGQRDIIRAGTHGGMAATSVLEPVSMLYRYTGDKRYLDFAQYIVRACDRPNGPKIIRSLAETGSVFRTANAKAYEMMSNLVGLLELYRLTGNETFLNPAQIAWKDIVANRLYITGATSAGEYFKEDQNLPGEEIANVGEGCATVTWLELNWHLLRLTGEAQYAGQIERTVYNQLLGAQDPGSGNICYFTPLVGRKRPSAGISCCVSSEPRGISMIPQFAWGARDDGVAVLLYAPGEAVIPLRQGGEVGLRSETKFPLDGNVALTVQPVRAARFPVHLRVPAWCTRFIAAAGSETASGQPGQFLTLDRTWKPGDTIRIQMDLPIQVLHGGKSYADYVALQRGPQVLALEAALNPQLPYLHRAAPKSIDPAQIQLQDLSAKLPSGWAGRQAYSTDGIFSGRSQPLVLVPFADAVNYRVWLVRPDRMPVGPVAVTAFGVESSSRVGAGDGSICDERSDTFRTTFDGRQAKEDWYAVEMEKPADIVRVVFRHGRLFENGGWFDTSAGKPRVQVKRTRTGPWETVATLDSYPNATAVQAPAVRDGEPFTVKLAPPVRAVAVRVAARPGGSFSSCAELSAYAQ